MTASTSPEATAFIRAVNLVNDAVGYDGSDLETARKLIGDIAWAEEDGLDRGHLLEVVIAELIQRARA
ncbi:hypothetical protein JDN40_14470 [Rhodomicrobium vannielii ATCC 17100]|uniref:hypothetical protein n=1 Tax=Rhodomicrobium vannielii TaxID=1069 RepID=UPI00191A3E3F|nr:hypothetical protein [Rhodomicrobium vannielii]MBJ7535313.1 hypothetical protein [Rhodomicrobium vannielii ATCC 17100]